MKNLINDNGVEREMTVKEQKEYDLWKQELVDAAEADAAAKEAKAAAKAQLLAKLGITADEAALLLS